MPNCTTFLTLLLGIALLPACLVVQGAMAQEAVAREAASGTAEVSGQGGETTNPEIAAPAAPAIDIVKTSAPPRQQPAGGEIGLVTFLQNPLNLIMLAVMLFFFVVLWPQQRQMKAQQLALANALAALKKNDRILTSGGIHGVVVQANSGEPTITIRIDENSGARMTINRDAVVRVLSNEPLTK